MVSSMLMLFARKNSIAGRNMVRETQKGFKVFYRSPKNLINFCLRKVQGINVYRWIARSFQPGTEIKEADEKDMRAFYAWSSPDTKPANVNFSGLNDPNVTNIVAKRRNRIIGFVQLVKYDENTDFYEGYWIFGLVVRNFYRGRGIGISLSQSAIEKARSGGAKEILLWVYEDNLPAINLYHKLGFKTKLIPKLEPLLNKELESRRRRRVVMVKSLSKLKSI
jgi:ribosomal protein S18 acetylase RimI-like enzyme